MNNWYSSSPLVPEVMNPYTATSEGIRRGCWSCRARRKRCDGRSPKCSTCERLGIQCAGFGTCRPIWMDGGVQQEFYCRSLKEIVKSIRRSSRRKTTNKSRTDNPNNEADREFHNFSGTSSPTIISQPSSSQEISIDSVWLGSQPVVDDLDWLSWGHEDVPLESCDLNSGIHDLESSDPGTRIHELQFPMTPLNSRRSSTVRTDSKLGVITDPSADWLFVMRYFDTTAERIFPFYYDLRKGEDRGYLLSLAHRSVLVRRSITSIAAFDCEKNHLDLKDCQWPQFYREASALFQINFDTLWNEHCVPSDSTYELCMDLLVSLLHLIILDDFVPKGIRSRRRFEQAIILIELFDKNDNQIPFFQLSSTESRMQAFFTSVLVRYFVIWRATNPLDLGWSSLPKLLQSLANNVPDCFCGYSWSLLKIMSEISNLIDWKAEKIAANILGTLELAKRAHEIEGRLIELIETRNDFWDGNAYLNLRKTADPPASISQSATSPCHYRHCSDGNHGNTGFLQEGKHQDLANRIMGHAMLIFLYTVVFGPNPQLTEIQRSVQSATVLLKEAEKAIGQRQIAVAWPTSIIASMVSAEKKEVCEWISDLVKMAKPQHAVASINLGADLALDCGFSQSADKQCGSIDW